MFTLEDILKELGSFEPFDDEGILTNSGFMAMEKLNRITTGLYNIGAIKETPDDIECYCDEIIRLGF